MSEQTKQKRLIRLPEVITKVGLSRSTIYARIDRKKFPTPVPIGGNRVAWLEQDIDQWIDDHVNLVRRASA